jgi:23S rRNA (adenine2030-N6)-methyltransferase
MERPATSYDHRHHAGNAGDVWKHVAWLSVLASFKRERVEVLDTHAGRGGYQLGPTGEWQGGVGRLLLQREESTGSGAVDRYLARIRRAPLGTCPGSPLLTLQALGRADRLVAWEADEGAAADLRRALAGDPRAVARTGDGWSAPELTAGPPRVVLVDPPYSEKEDWTRVVAAVAAAWRAGHTVVAWYPIKRWSRPNLLLSRLREAGVASVAVDLLWTPMELEKRTMVGAGVVLVRVARASVLELHAAAAVLGPALATHDGRWSLRSTGTGDPSLSERAGGSPAGAGPR